MASNNILQMDMASVAPFQDNIYKGTSEGEEVESHLSFALTKVTQAPKIKIKMDKTPKGDGEIVYTASNRYDSLGVVEAHISLGSVKVAKPYKKSVQICYHHNLGHNILYEGILKIDDVDYQVVDSIYADMYSQFFVTKRNLYNQMIGSVECYENWTLELPNIKLVVPQHYFFCRHSKVSLPILKGDNKITFVYKVRTDLRKLLRMKIKTQSGEWKEVPCNLKYLDVKSSKIENPELWGTYSEMTDAERNWKQSINQKTKRPEEQTIYIEDIDRTGSNNAYPVGDNVEISLESGYPAKHIFWTCQLENGHLSNYTTDKYSVYNGWNPCTQAALKYGNSERVARCGHQHFDQSEAYHYFPGEPLESGYNCYTFQYYPGLISQADNAVVLKDVGAKLEVMLGDTNPFTEPEEEKEYTDKDGNLIPKEALEDLEEIEKSKRDKYNVFVRTVIMRKLTVSWDKVKNKCKYHLE